MDDRSRICLNWHPFTSHSGAARRALELHRPLQEKFAFTAFVTGELPAEFRKELPSFRFVETAPSRHPLLRLREGRLPWWRRLLEEAGSADLWITDTLPVPRFREVPTLITVHDLRHTERRDFVSRRRYLKLRCHMRSSLRRADAVVAVSEWGAEQLRKHYGVPSGKLSVIPNAVDPGISSLEILPERQIPGPYILSVGHLEVRKNLGMLVDAFALLADRWSGKLVLAGADGGCASTLRSRAENAGLGDRVVFTGPVSGTELRTLYRDCELLACPSLYEGFGMTLLEGMAMGRPVVASDIPSHEEVAGDAVVRVPLGSGVEKRFADAMSALLEDTTAAAERGRRSREFAQSRTWDRSVELLEALYHRMTGGGAV